MNLSAIGIVSRDLSSSIHFYEQLGLKFEKIGDGHYEATTKSGLRLMLDSLELVKKLNPDFNDKMGSGMMLCFEQDSSQQVDKVFAQLTQAGAETVREPWDAFWGQRYSSVKDPDGNQVDIFAEI